MTATRHYKHWTAAEDRRLSLLWGSLSLRETAATLGRTEVTVYHRAQGLGLPLGCPRGMEWLTDAAKRAGYDTGQLRKILAAVGHRVHRSLSRPRLGKPTRHFHYVDPIDVDDAVAAWVKLEPVVRAAERHGLSDDTLRRLLLDAGEKPPRRHRARWMVSSEVVARVVATYRAKQTVAEHARRVGIYRTTLAKRLRDAGVLGPKRAGVNVRLPVDVVDRAIGRAA